MLHIKSVILLFCTVSLVLISLYLMLSVVLRCKCCPQQWRQNSSALFLRVSVVSSFSSLMQNSVELRSQIEFPKFRTLEQLLLLIFSKLWSPRIPGDLKIGCLGKLCGGCRKPQHRTKTMIFSVPRSDSVFKSRIQNQFHTPGYVVTYICQGYYRPELWKALSFLMTTYLNALQSFPHWWVRIAGSVICASKLMWSYQSSLKAARSQICEFEIKPDFGFWTSHNSYPVVKLARNPRIRSFVFCAFEYMAKCTLWLFAVPATEEEYHTARPRIDWASGSWCVVTQEFR